MVSLKNTKEITSKLRGENIQGTDIICKILIEIYDYKLNHNAISPFPNTFVIETIVGESGVR